MILERAGGRVDVRNSPLGGVRFAVTIPRCSAHTPRINGQVGVI
jgi:signal transduction histidine kinase